jgi:hypothetical protein
MKPGLFQLIVLVDQELLNPETFVHLWLFTLLHAHDEFSSKVASVERNLWKNRRSTEFIDVEIHTLELP